MNKEKEEIKSNNYIKSIKKEIYSKTLIARSRRYFFDTNETNAGDYYLTITESKKLYLNDGRSFFRKHKIFLYKEDFNDFKKILSDMIKFIYDKKGKESIFKKIEEKKTEKKEKIAKKKEKEKEKKTEKKEKIAKKKEKE
ncbi:MAG: PUR family DNA/RNA-binding protein, partial [Candidatus Shikimatogenerans bostrichidophilus]